METVTLSGEDFKTVHNTLCDLRDIEMRLNGVLNTEMVERLHRVIKGFEAGLANAYEQDNSVFERKMDYYGEFKQDNGLDAIWSIYELPVHGFLQDHPYKGAVEVRYHETSAPVKGTTWADLYRAADLAIQRSGDSHHIFIEGFEPYTAGDNSVLWLTTGS